MPLPRALARFNRRVTNRVMGLWAGRLPPWMVVHHRGRTTGTRYQTPVWAFPTEHSMVVALTYGADSDWVRNVLASGGTVVERAGQEFAVTAPRVVRGQEGFALLPSIVHPPLRALGVDEFLVMEIAPPSG